jgi:hypothetical protein
MCSRPDRGYSLRMTGTVTSGARQQRELIVKLHLQIPVHFNYYTAAATSN